MHEKVKDRLDRAQNSSFELFVKHERQAVLEIESDDSVYTIVPNVAYCSCPDRQYRDQPCKHLLYAALESDTDVRETLLSGFESKVEGIIEDLAEADQAAGDDLEQPLIWSDAIAAVDDAFRPEDAREERATEIRRIDGNLIPVPTDREAEDDVIARIASSATN